MNTSTPAPQDDARRTIAINPEKSRDRSFSTPHAARRTPLCPPAIAATTLLEEAASFIDLLDDRTYIHASRLLPDGTIGKHFRHVVDHFAAALAPLRDGADELRVISYDRRERNVPMETCRTTAVREIRAVIHELGAAGTHEAALPVTVRVMLAADGSEHDFPSTLGRELAFASHHAVHHHAMIQAIARELGVPIPAGFGKAPATLNHEQHVQR